MCWKAFKGLLLESSLMCHVIWKSCLNRGQQYGDDVQFNNFFSICILLNAFKVLYWFFFNKTKTLFNIYFFLISVKKNQWLTARFLPVQRNVEELRWQVQKVKSSIRNGEEKIMTREPSRTPYPCWKGTGLKPAIRISFAGKRF